MPNSPHDLRDIRTIAFDADDTLWRHQDLFEGTQARFVDLLRGFHDEDWIAGRLHEAEMRNLRLYGYGVKGFMLSMVETAIELTEGRIGGAEIQRILDLGKTMLDHPIDLMPGVAEALAQLAGTFELMVITKGDLFDQETKLARSALGAHFKAVEVVSEKDAAAYAAILKRHGIGPAHFLMVGNSLKSDVLPVLAVGGRAVHVPYELQWSHDRVEGASAASHGYLEIASLSELPGLLADTP
ncbi:MAG: HAD family hydrolase [Holophagaceae bacterium]|nr:HAD family hydrolase [Holophagaceae bacterium]